MPSKRRSPDKIAVIDLFAGPGGLGEGFSSSKHGGKYPFDIVLSAEKDPMAQKTLELRSFVRKFRGRSLPKAYWKFLAGEISRADLFARHRIESDEAIEESRAFELSEGNRRQLEKRLDGLHLDRDRTIVIGGPPCQAYSVAGRSRNGAKVGWTLETDDRSHLYLEYLHVLAHAQPAAFVMENVRGMLSARLDGESVFEMIRNDLHRPRKALGLNPGGRLYRLFPVVAPKEEGHNLFDVFESPRPEDFLVRTEEHGIPQARHRVIIVGLAEDLAGDTVPTPIERISSAVTVKSAIKDLPKIRSVISSGTDSHGRWLAAIEGALKKRGMADDVREVMERAVDKASKRDLTRGKDWIQGKNGNPPTLNHQSRGHMESDLQRYLFASSWATVHGVSPTLDDFPRSLLPHHANIGGAGVSAIFNDRFRVQSWDRPSTTIVSHISKDGHYYIHPDPSQCRSLTVREAATLQTFPDDYFFCGPRTSQYHQVGNAVPVMLARQIADLLHTCLEP